jgi:hypothetical protein
MTLTPSTIRILPLPLCQHVVPVQTPAPEIEDRFATVIRDIWFPVHDGLAGWEAGNFVPCRIGISDVTLVGSSEDGERRV